MFRFKKLIAVGIFTAAAAVATQSNATTYLLTASDNFGTGSYGTVKVTQAGVDTLKYVITLADGFNFTDTGSHEAFAFALKGAPVITSYTAPTGFSLTRSVNGVKDAPFDGFDYGLDCSSVCAPSNPGYTGGTTPSSLVFTVKAPGLTDSLVDYGAKAYDSHHVYFAADVIKTKNCSGNCTGTVGSISFIDDVPEPGTWAMMTMGIGAIGFALRRRRQGAVQPVQA